MLEFLFAGDNAAFAVALLLLLVLFVVELASLLFGAELSGVLGDLDLPDPDLDMDPGALGNLDALTKFLYWLRIGKVPVMVAVVLFLAAFAVCGLVLQWLALRIFGVLLPWYVAVPAAAVLALPAVRTFGAPIGRIMPRDETDAIGKEELIGLRGSIVLGTASRGSPAQAKIRDRRGTTHYAMVEPDVDGESFAAGDSVLLVRSDGVRFFVIADPGDAGDSKST